MIDHFGLHCRDSSVSLAFYRACLAPLGIEVVEEQPQWKAAIFMRRADGVFWWLGEAEGERRAEAGAMRLHLGFRARTPAEVDAFHAAALAAGGHDNGPPGWRRPTCYSAFVFDPDGHNIEAICQSERGFA